MLRFVEVTPSVDQHRDIPMRDLDAFLAVVQLLQPLLADGDRSESRVDSQRLLRRPVGHIDPPVIDRQLNRTQRFHRIDDEQAVVSKNVYVFIPRAVEIAAERLLLAEFT